MCSFIALGKISGKVHIYTLIEMQREACTVLLPPPSGHMNFRSILSTLLNRLISDNPLSLKKLEMDQNTPVAMMFTANRRMIRNATCCRIMQNLKAYLILNTIFAPFFTVLEGSLPNIQQSLVQSEFTSHMET